jgi:hypothetical protein
MHVVKREDSRRKVISSSKTHLPRHHGAERGVIVPDIFRGRLILHWQPEDAIRGRHLFSLRVQAYHEMRQLQIAEMECPVEQLL